MIDKQRAKDIFGYVLTIIVIYTLFWIFAPWPPQ